MSGGPNGHGVSITSSSSADGVGGGGKPLSGSHQRQHHTSSTPFIPLASLTGPGAGFHTPGKTYFDAGEDEDLDEELDDDDSYEENDDDDNHGDELLNDKMTNWVRSQTKVHVIALLRRPCSFL